MSKNVQAERNEACFKLPKRSQSYGKNVQAERNEACFKLPKRSQSYGKNVQAERKYKHECRACAESRLVLSWCLKRPKTAYYAFIHLAYKDFQKRDL
ncbi:MAG: hypothetical protein RR280_06895 [Bacteroidaceae bacterium]